MPVIVPELRTFEVKSLRICSRRFDSLNQYPWAEKSLSVLKATSRPSLPTDRGPHLSLGPGIPEPAAAFLPWQGHDRHCFAQDCRVASRGVLGGLHHEYRWERIAA